ncbi:MAG: hypothetical protein IPJ28_18455 [Betaproteobacteria bacterium]|nr:hypothetical protein [Betaproteobacteria bacterium]
MSVLEPGPCGSATVVTPFVAFGSAPTVELVIGTVIVQLPAGIVMPVKLRAVAPAANDAGVTPVQVPPTAPGAATVMLMRVSRKVPPVWTTPVGFVSV